MEDHMAKEDLEGAILVYRNAKIACDVANEERDKAEQIVLRLMGKQQTCTITDDYSTIQATVVKGTRLKIDEDRLKKNLGATMWAKVTKRVLDKAKLEDAIARGAVSPVDVATCSEEVPNKTYVKLTEKRRTG
jgi:hypothetical protein